jgi:hypothetical protein
MDGFNQKNTTPKLPRETKILLKSKQIEQNITSYKTKILYKEL